MFGNYEVADLVAYYFMSIDIKCRGELQNGRIVSERDYVSSFATRLRDSLIHEFQCHSQTLRPSIENENGVDGIIVFRHENHVKIGMFEAKRPQLKSPNYAWDYLSSRRISHFTEQVENQRIWRNAFAIWEFFLNETPDGTLSPPYQPYGSSCVWHNRAFSFANRERLYPNPWTTKKLSKLMQHDGVSLYSVIFEIISCKQGKIFEIGKSMDTVTVINPNNNDIVMEIPLPIDNTPEIDERITRFLERNKFESYSFVDLGRKKF